MSQALWVVAALVVGGVVFINRCEWLKWCDPLPAGLSDIETIIKNTFKGSSGNNTPAQQKQLAEAIGSGSLTPEQHNKLPTIGNTKDSNYRTTRITGKASDPAAVKVIQSGQLHPEDPIWAKYRANIKESQSNLALSLYGHKMSVY